MTSLYPPIEPFAENFIKVSAIHTVYYEQCGNPKGKPVLFVHGGPGGGLDPDYRRFFHPEKYHVILVDQRGAGKSTPHHEVEDNNTMALISDFEKIREACGVDQWMVFGGSWGSTLGLAYAQAHPDRTTELVLRGIFLGGHEENRWLFGGEGANYLFPDYWEDFVRIIPEEDRGDLLQAYYHRLMSDDEEVVREAAYAWSQWEMRISYLHPDLDQVEQALKSPKMMSLAVLECHFMHYGCFLSPNQLLNSMDKIQHIPGYIVHGRYDAVCAPESAWRLHQQWPGSELQFVFSGHSLKDPAMAEAMVGITDHLVDP